MRFTPTLAVQGGILIALSPLVVSQAIICSSFNVTDAIAVSIASGIDLYGILGAGVMANATIFMTQLVAEAANYTAPGPTLATSSKGLAPGIDVHVHYQFPWYTWTQPYNPTFFTPTWDPIQHIQFDSEYNIVRSVLSASSPQANVKPGNQNYTIAIARMLNINAACVHNLYPKYFDFFAQMPLPYTAAAIAEADYSLDTLGAVGIGLATNHEGIYLGDPTFVTPFIAHINNRTNTEKSVIFIHPVNPVNVNLNFAQDNPLLSRHYQTAEIEWYVDTARTWMDLVATGTLLNFTNIHWISDHLGGAFWDTWGRQVTFINNTAFTDANFEVLTTRVWYDSAGTDYPQKPIGLLGWGVPPSQFVFGTDWPWANKAENYGYAIGNVTHDPCFTVSQLDGIMYTNTYDGVFSGNMSGLAPKKYPTSSESTITQECETLFAISFN